MKTLRINIKDKIATFFQRDGVIVCGNKGYKIIFTFDEEWAEHTTKTARFIWNGHYYDKQFTDNECEVPVINDTTKVTVGVYAGDLKTTTPAEIPCLISILCGNPEYIEENIKEYRDIAQKAAEEAQQSAKEAKQAAIAVVHPTIDVEEIEGGHRLTINDADGEKTFDVMDGEGSGEQGLDGEDGATFTPSVSSDGILSWTNNKGLPNPDSVNIKGTPGVDGKDGKDGVDGIDGKDGVDGVGISKSEINTDGELVITYSSGTTVNLGKVVGEDGSTVIIDEVDASKVIFGEEVTTGYAVGNIKLENGKGILARVGDNLLQVMKNIWTKANPPKIVQPSVTVTFPAEGQLPLISSYPSKGGSYEAGTYFEKICFRATFNKGSYEYDNDNGVQFEVRDGVGFYFTDGRGNSRTDKYNPSPIPVSGYHMFYKLRVTESTNFVITARANHTAGTIPHDSLGGEYPEGQITTTSTTGYSGAITGYRNTFYGVLTSKEELTNDNIRSICWESTMKQSNANWVNGQTFNISIPKSENGVNVYRVLIAYPANLRDLTEVIDKNDSNANIVTGFRLVKDSSGNLLKIGGYNNYNPIEYKVYVMDFANPYDTANTFTVTI